MVTRIADRYSSQTLGAVCHGRSKVDGKNVHLCCLCLFSGWCPNVPYRNIFCYLCAINRIINAHNSEATKDIFVIFVCDLLSYLLQKVLSGWGELWGCWAWGQLGHSGLGSAGARWEAIRNKVSSAVQLYTGHCSLHSTALSQCSVSGACENSMALAVCFRVEQCASGLSQANSSLRVLVLHWWARLTLCSEYLCHAEVTHCTHNSSHSWISANLEQTRLYNILKVSHPPAPRVKAQGDKCVLFTL